MIDTIRAKARELLESGQVSCFIGYEKGTMGRTRPAFIYEPGDVARVTLEIAVHRYYNLAFCKVEARYDGCCLAESPA